MCKGSSDVRENWGVFTLAPHASSNRLMLIVF